MYITRNSVNFVVINANSNHVNFKTNIRKLSTLLNTNNNDKNNNNNNKMVLIKDSQFNSQPISFQQIRHESSKNWFVQDEEHRKTKTPSLFNIGRQKILKLKTEGNTYHEKVVLGYSREQICDLVYDVAKYKEFVPFCINSEIIQEPNGVQNSLNNANRLNLNLRQNGFNLRRNEPSQTPSSNQEAIKSQNGEISRVKSFRAKLEIGVPPIRESYISHVNMVRPDLVKAVSKDTRLFEYLINEWKFHPYKCQELSKENCCIIEFFVSFKFRSVVYNNAATLFIDQVFGKMVNAFTNRAEIKYGKASMQPKILS
jgi:ribosome-associated toxin RatA of RatAB toxin-antitoxin module